MLVLSPNFPTNVMEFLSYEELIPANCCYDTWFCHQTSHVELFPANCCRDTGHQSSSLILRMWALFSLSKFPRKELIANKKNRKNFRYIVNC